MIFKELIKATKEKIWKEWSFWMLLFVCILSMIIYKIGITSPYKEIITILLLLSAVIIYIFKNFYLLLFIQNNEVLCIMKGGLYTNEF